MSALMFFSKKKRWILSQKKKVRKIVVEVEICLQAIFLLFMSNILVIIFTAWWLSVREYIRLTKWVNTKKNIKSLSQLNVDRWTRNNFFYYCRMLFHRRHIYMMYIWKGTVKFVDMKVEIDISSCWSEKVDDFCRKKRFTS